MPLPQPDRAPRAARCLLAGIALLVAACGDGHDHEYRGDLLTPADLASLDSLLRDTSLARVDRFGQPIDTVDRRHFAALLQEAEFDSLEAMLDERYRATLADIRHEGRLHHAFEAFYQANPTIEPALHAWRVARPSSAHAEAATAYFLLGRSIEVRGSAFASATAADRFRAMRVLGTEARRHADEALRRDARHVVAHLTAVNLLTHGGADSATAVRTLQEALTAQPHSYLLRHAVLTLLEPRWGGSIEAMRAFVETGEPLYDSLPAIRALAGSVPLAEARAAHADPEMALALLDQASMHGEDYFLALAYGERYRLQNRWIDALRAYHRAWALRPQGRSMTLERGQLLVAIGALTPDSLLRVRAWAAAEQDLLLARELRVPAARVSASFRALAVARGACRTAPPPCFSE